MPANEVFKTSSSHYRVGGVWLIGLSAEAFECRAGWGEIGGIIFGCLIGLHCILNFPLLFEHLSQQILGLECWSIFRLCSLVDIGRVAHFLRHPRFGFGNEIKNQAASPRPPVRVCG